MILLQVRAMGYRLSHHIGDRKSRESKKKTWKDLAKGDGPVPYKTQC